MIPNSVLTISVFAEVLWCWFSWQALARLVDRPDSELVDLLLFQTLDLGLADWLLRGEHFDEVQCQLQNGPHTESQPAELPARLHDTGRLCSRPR